MSSSLLKLGTGYKEKVHLIFADIFCVCLKFSRYKFVAFFPWGSHSHLKMFYFNWKFLKGLMMVRNKTLMKLYWFEGKIKIIFYNRAYNSVNCLKIGLIYFFVNFLLMSKMFGNILGHIAALRQWPFKINISRKTVMSWQNVICSKT